MHSSPLSLLFACLCVTFASACKTILDYKDVKVDEISDVKNLCSGQPCVAGSMCSSGSCDDFNQYGYGTCKAGLFGDNGMVIIIGLLVVVGLGIGGFLYYKKKQDNTLNGQLAQQPMLK